MTDQIPAIPIVKGRHAAAQIVLGQGADEKDREAAGEIQRYVQKLAGAILEIVTPEQALSVEDAALLLVGDPDSNPLVERVLQGKYDPKSLKPEGFVIHTGEVDGRPAVAISGHSGVATVYAAYALIELLGATFLLSGDVLPPPVDDLSLPATSRVWEPAFSRRGIQPFPNDLQDVTWGATHYKKIIDQMVKLRMNYLEFFVQAYQPWVEYQYRGEKNLLGDLSTIDSGYIVIARTVPSCNVSEVEIGKEHFAGMRRMAPPEMQDVETQEEAVRRFSAMVKEIQRYAKSKGLSLGMSLDPTYVAPNHARFAQEYDARPHSTVYGAHVSANDPVGLEISEAWLRAIFDTYTDIDDIFLFLAEIYEIYEDEESRKAIAELRPLFAGARRTVEKNWHSLLVRWNRTLDQIIDCDVGSLVFVRKMVGIARRLNPDVRVGAAFFFKGFMLPEADKVIDRDVPFMDMQSYGVVPIKDDVNASYFSDMGERDRYINCRIDDDGSMFGMPFYLRQFERDGLFAEALEAGASGYVGQIFRSRGTEHHTRYLAHGAWEPGLTSEEFYRRYTNELFGPNAAPAVQRAFGLLEDLEEWLGWRGNRNFGFGGGCAELNGIFAPQILEQEIPYYGPPDPAAMVNEANGQAAMYTPGIALLERALAELRQAQPAVNAKGEYFLRYLVSKTEAYLSHLQMVLLLDQAFAAYAQAFVDHAVDEPALADALAAAEAIFVAAGNKAREATERAGEIVDDLSDLGILFLSNVWSVADCDKVIEVVRRVVAFHQGLPYWQEGAVRRRYGSRSNVTVPKKLSVD